MRITSTSLSLARQTRQALIVGLVFASLVLPVRLSAQAAGAKPKPAAPAAPAGAPAAAGAPRVVDIAAGDDMKYTVTSITAKPGEQIKIRLSPKGSMPKIAMSHNFVLLKLGTDAAAFVNAGISSRPTDFIAPDKKAMVLASTTLAGNGETVEVTFKAPAAPGSYPYVCTFPGHFAGGMKGTLLVKK
jgi:azurin